MKCSGMPEHFLAGMAEEGSLAQTIFDAGVSAMTQVLKSSCRIVRLMARENGLIRSGFAQIRFLPMQQHTTAGLDQAFCLKVRLSSI